MEPQNARQRSRRCLFLKKDFRLAAKIVPEIIPVVIVPEIVPVAIVSPVVVKGTRRYDHRRRSPVSGRPDAVLAVVSIYPDVARSWTRGPHHRQRRGRAETDTY